MVTRDEEYPLVRAKMYALLSKVYYEAPDSAFIELVLKMPFGNCDTPQLIREGFNSIRLAISSLPKDEVTLKLASEFTRLFRGVRLGEIPPPYESVYREGVCFGKVTEQVIDEYANFGLKLKEASEPPDHISLELGFMSYLCMKEADARRDNRCDEVLKLLKRERHFLEEHLLSWVGDFFKNVRECDRTGYYRGWVDVTEGWLLLDLEQISKMIDISEF